jgi:hypothetical protein
VPFESPDENLGDLLGRVAAGKVQLPDFQREWKWDDDRIGSLLASVSLGYPVGVVMTLEVGGDGVRFAPKPLAGVVAMPVSPDELLLDGQQRLTSLFQALYSGLPVDTTDARGKRLTRRYYVDIAKALDPEVDREEAIVSVPEDRKLRDDFGRMVVADYSTTELECKAEMFPLSRVLDPGTIFGWQNTYMETAPGSPSQRSSRWLAFYNAVVGNFTQYKVPVIRLQKSTPKEAVCVVFEKVNTGGIALNVFELLTATFASDNFRLKDDWAKRKAILDHRPVLRSVESADFLQAISLLTTYDRRRSHLAKGGEPSQAPGVSCKRKDILRLGLEDYKRWADKVTDAFGWAGQFLGQEHIYRAADLPYRTQLVPLAAIRVILGGTADLHGNAQKLHHWYWCGVLGELYGGAIETRFARDLEQVVDWIGDGAQPGSVVEASFRAPRLLTLRTRNSAAYKGIYALLMRRGCMDWVRHEPMDYASFFEYQVDIHHVFPKAWCDKNGIDPAHRESIVNKTAISATTNRSIGGRSPKEYMMTLSSKAGVSDDDIDKIVATHLISPSHLRAADFPTYFKDRTEALLTLISDAMGKEAIREDDSSGEGDAAAFIDEPEEPPDDLLNGSPT